MVYHSWGVDKSHFDSPTGTAQIVSEGFSFMTHKLGGDANDAEAASWWADAKPHRASAAYVTQWLAAYNRNPAGPPAFERVILGGYWVLYPGHGASAGDSFVARLNSQCPGWSDDLFILQLDCEEWNNDKATMPLLADIRACANRLRVLAPKLVPIVYAPHWAYGNTLTGLGFPLWSSSYTTAKGTAQAIYPGDSYSGWARYGGETPTIAQFSSTATVAGDSTTDVNCFKDTPAALARLLAPGFPLEEVDVSFEDDQVPVRWPSTDPANPNWTGPNALGDARDKAAEALSRVKDLQTAVSALSSGQSALASQVAAVKAQLASGVTANVDVQALASALSALLPGVEVDEQTLVQAFRDMANAVPRPAVGEVATERAAPGDPSIPIHNVAADAYTKRMRQDRQDGVQG